jgi:von Willebrand factor type A domain/Aerotolerance regulator N-terminal
MGILYQVMLWGMVATAIPPIIHLLNRRRYDIIDWGAMQFLQISEVTRRRLLIEELLLMLVRMVIIALLVLMLTEPILHVPSGQGSSPFSFGQQPSRNVVLVFDPSASMSFKTGEKSAYEKGREWADKFIDGLSPNDAVAIVVARPQPFLQVPHLSSDRVYLKDQVQKLPSPGGSANLPRAVQAAYTILEADSVDNRVVIVLSDAQKHGFSDARTVLGWEDLASKRDAKTDVKPDLWIVNLDPDRPAKPTNWSLLPLTTTRAVVAVKQEILFRSGFLITGAPKYEQPYAVSVKVDGKVVDRWQVDKQAAKPGESKFVIESIRVPKEAPLENGQVPLSFSLKIDKPGSHIVSLIVEPDPPPEKRKKGYVVRDHLPLDNQRDFAVEVLPVVPVLIVDGEEPADPKEKADRSSRASDFLLKALAPENDDSPNFKVKVVGIKEFNNSLLREADPNQKAEDRPSVVIFSNVPEFTSAQRESIEAFLREGGGVLMTMGNRVKDSEYNQDLFREGKGWFPVRLVKKIGDENEPKRFKITGEMLGTLRREGVPETMLSRLNSVKDKEFAADQFTPQLGALLDKQDRDRYQDRVLTLAEIKPVTRPVRDSLTHPALEMFGKPGIGGLDSARFNAWWKLEPSPDDPDTSVIGVVDRDEQPLFVERRVGEGRLIVSAVPLDNSWKTNLVDQPAFVPLVHELTHYLAEARSAQFNLAPGQPLRYRLPRGGSPDGFTLQGPSDKQPKPIEVGAEQDEEKYTAKLVERSLGPVLLHEGMGEAGVWRLNVGDRTVYYVVHSDAKESDLAPSEELDRSKLPTELPFKYENDVETLVENLALQSQTLKIWWWCLIAALGMMCVELWLARHIGRKRA